MMHHPPPEMAWVHKRRPTEKMSEGERRVSESPVKQVRSPGSSYLPRESADLDGAELRRGTCVHRQCSTARGPTLGVVVSILT